MEEYCSMYANVTGIKFYHGVQELHPFLHVRVKREAFNPYDRNAVEVIAPSGSTLGHLERKTAAVLAPIMDALPEILIKR